MNQKDPSIVKLPEEVMTKVFELLDGSSLMNCALVCRKWNEMIGQSSAVMKKLSLALKFEKGIPGPQELVRKYHTVKCAVLFASPELDELEFRNLKKLFSQQGGNLRFLELNHARFALSQANFLNKVFRSLNKLEVLKFDNSYVIDENFKFDLTVAIKKLKPHSLPRLKSVVLLRSDLNLLRLIGTTKLTSLKIYRFEGKTKITSNVIDFLAAQNELEEFVFHYNEDTDFEDPPDIEKLRKINFPLKRLEIHNLECLLETEENILTFLNKFTDTLEELRLSTPYPNSVYEMIFDKFLKLKTLDVNIRSAPSEESFYRNLLPNLSVQKLIARGSPIWFASSFQGIIGNLPSVKELIVQGNLSREHMTFIANNLQLKSLQFRSLDKQLFNGINMPSVQFLSFEMFSPSSTEANDSKDWKALSAAMPNVETFSINVISDASTLNNFLNICTKKWLRLKHIRLGRGFVAEKCIFDQLLSDCLDLKTVEFDESAFDNSSSEKAEITNYSKSNGLSLIVHSKREEWNKINWEYGLWEGIEK